MRRKINSRARREPRFRLFRPEARSVEKVRQATSSLNMLMSRASRCLYAPYIRVGLKFCFNFSLTLLCINVSKKANVSRIISLVTKSDRLESLHSAETMSSGYGCRESAFASPSLRRCVNEIKPLVNLPSRPDPQRRCRIQCNEKSLRVRVRPRNSNPHSNESAPPTG